MRKGLISGFPMPSGSRPDHTSKSKEVTNPVELRRLLLVVVRRMRHVWRP
jgi:hypothetical protein